MKSRPGDYVHALVTSVLPLEIRARVGPASQLPAGQVPAGQQNNEIVLLPEDWLWTGQRHGDALVKPGDIIYVHLADAMEGTGRRATLEQDSGAQGALMAMDNTTGDVLAMVGGRDVYKRQDRGNRREPAPVPFLSRFPTPFPILHFMVRVTLSSHTFASLKC